MRIITISQLDRYVKSPSATTVDPRLAVMKLALVRFDVSAETRGSTSPRRQRLGSSVRRALGGAGQVAVIANAGGSDDPPPPCPSEISFREAVPVLLVVLAGLRRRPKSVRSDDEWAEILQQVALSFLLRGTDPSCFLQIPGSSSLRAVAERYVNRATTLRILDSRRAHQTRERHLHNLVPLALGAEHEAYRCPGAPGPASQSPVLKAQLREGLDSLDAFDRRHASRVVIPSRDLVRDIYHGYSLAEVAAKSKVPCRQVRRQWELVSAYLQRFLECPGGP